MSQGRKVIIAGPTCSDKTSFSMEFLPRESDLYSPAVDAPTLYINTGEQLALLDLSEQ